MTTEDGGAVPSMERKLTATERFLNGPERGDEAGLARKPAKKEWEKINLKKLKFEHLFIIKFFFKVKK
jgi:hypothetical protein